MVNHEKVQHLSRIFLKHTGLEERSNIDVNDLKVYINHALENGLVGNKEVTIVDDNILKS